MLLEPLLLGTLTTEYVCIYVFCRGRGDKILTGKVQSKWLTLPRYMYLETLFFPISTFIGVTQMLCSQSLTCVLCDHLLMYHLLSDIFFAKGQLAT